MNRQEFAQLTMALKTYYPKENIIPNDKALELWFREISDIPYEVAELALRKWVSNNQWAPTIADMRRLSREIVFGEIPDWGQAWNIVLMAIRNFGSYRASEAMDTFDEITYEVVKRIGFRHLCMSENIVADRAHFMKLYEQLAERKQKEDNMCLELREHIKNLIQDNENKKIEG